MKPSELSRRLREQVCDRYELPGITHVVPLGGDDNRAFRISTVAGEDLVLRLSHPDPEAKDKNVSEFMVLDYLRQHTELHVPAPHRDKQNRYFSLVGDEEGSGLWQVSLFGHVEGEALDPEQASSDTLLLVGRTLGRLDLALRQADSDITPTPSRTRGAKSGQNIVTWVVKQFSQDLSGASLFGVEEEEAARDTIVKISDRLQRHCKQLEKSLPHQLLHGDVHLDNLLVNKQAIGILDFSNMAYGPRIFELAAPLQMFYERNDSGQLRCGPGVLGEMRKALLAGYEESLSLTEAEVMAYPLFLALRLFVVLGWAAGRQSVPDWKTWLPLNGMATLRHIHALLDEFESHSVGARKLRVPQWVMKTFGRHQ